MALGTDPNTGTIDSPTFSGGAVSGGGGGNNNEWGVVDPTNTFGTPFPSDSLPDDILGDLAVNTPWDKDGLQEAWNEFQNSPHKEGWTPYTGNLMVDFFANVISWANSPTPPSDLSTAINDGQLPPASDSIENIPGSDKIDWNAVTESSGGGSGSNTGSTTPGTADGGEDKPSLTDTLMDAIKSQTGMSEEQWATAKPFWEQMFSEDNINRIMDVQGQGMDAFSQLFGEATTTSPFEQSVEDYGMEWLNTGRDILSGNWELPSGLVNQRQDEWDILREATSRGGNFISPEGVATSTAGAQQVGQFNRTWGEREDAFGLGLLGMANQGGLGAFGSLSSAQNQTYNTLFGAGQSLLSPMQGGASSLTASASGNIQGAANTAQGLLNSQNWMEANTPEETSWWQDLLATGSDVYTTWSLLNR